MPRTALLESPLEPWSTVSWFEAVLRRFLRLPYNVEIKGGFRARMRERYLVFLRRHIGECCGRCGRRYSDTLWWADDALWERVTACEYGLLCPSCFSQLAEQGGLLLQWMPRLHPSS